MSKTGRSLEGARSRSQIVVLFVALIIFIMLLFGMILYVSVFDVRRIMRDSRNDTQAKEAAAEAKKAAEPAKP